MFQLFIYLFNFNVAINISLTHIEINLFKYEFQTFSIVESMFEIISIKRENINERIDYNAQIFDGNFN